MQSEQTMPRASARLRPAAVMAAVAVGTAYVALVDPNESGHYPTCPFLAGTGYYCPGCGSLRMIHALAHGHVAEAFGRNPLAFITLPPLLWIMTTWVISSWRGVPLRVGFLRPGVVAAYTVAVLVFWAVRNLPFGQALAP